MFDEKMMNQIEHTIGCLTKIINKMETTGYTVSLNILRKAKAYLTKISRLDLGNSKDPHSKIDEIVNMILDSRKGGQNA